jgi:selenocysteine lyase/cysteine desulfurase
MSAAPPLPGPSRRAVLNLIGGTALLAEAPAAARQALAAYDGRSATDIAGEEAYWFAVRQAYLLDGRFIILNAGGSNPAPRDVIAAHVRNIEYISPSPLVNARRVGQFPAQLGDIRARLARLINASTDEVALTRNATEGLNIAISGLVLERGDEILTDQHGYYSVRWALDQRARRDGIVIRTVDVPLPKRPGADLAAPFRDAIGPRTRAIVVNHLVDGIGQIMPVADIAAAAHKRGVVVIADGALSFGQIVCDMQALGCDVYATSLHKFLGAPQGTGMLFVRKPLIPRIWPMYGVEDPAAPDITKFQVIGTRSYAEFGAIQPALDLLETIGPERKQARLQYLKRYWADQFKAEPRVRFGAGLDPADSCATLQVGIDGIEGGALARHLQKVDRIVTYGPIESNGINGIYIAPNTFTTLPDLDRLVLALKRVLASGIDQSVATA